MNARGNICQIYQISILDNVDIFHLTKKDLFIKFKFNINKYIPFFNVLSMVIIRPVIFEQLDLLNFNGEQALVARLSMRDSSSSTLSSMTFCNRLRRVQIYTILHLSWGSTSTIFLMNTAFFNNNIVFDLFIQYNNCKESEVGDLKCVNSLCAWFSSQHQICISSPSILWHFKFSISVLLGEKEKNGRWFSDSETRNHSTLLSKY